MSYLSKHMTPLGFKFHGDNGPGDKIKEKLEKAKAALKAKKDQVKSNKEKKNEPKVFGTNMTQAEFDARNKKAAEGFVKKGMK